MRIEKARARREEKKAKREEDRRKERERIALASDLEDVKEKLHAQEVGVCGIQYLDKLTGVLYTQQSKLFLNSSLTHRNKPSWPNKE